jgi:hypothetical protein
MIVIGRIMRVAVEGVTRALTAGLFMGMTVRARFCDVLRGDRCDGDRIVRGRM